MLLRPLIKLFHLLSLAVAITALPTQPSVLDAAPQTCESELARCLLLRVDLKHCRDTVCRTYGDECKPCKDGIFPDRTCTSPTSDNTAVEARVLNSRGATKPSKNYCIVICTHAHCGLLCTNPGHPPSSAVDTSEAAADTDTADLLANTNTLPDQLGLPLTDGMTTVITTLGKKDHEGPMECMWICSGKVNCRQACWAAGDASGALITDGSSLPEGEAVEGMGDCEIVEKGDVGPLTVCTVPETAGGEMFTAGDLDPNSTRCLIFWIGPMPHMICRKV